MILILAAAVATPTPSPVPTPAADVCGAPQSSLLATLDRPSIGYSPCAVKSGETILEAGYANSAAAAGVVPNWPQALLRVGAAPNVELDLIGGGSFDSGFGMKYELRHDGGRALGADFLYTVPTGSAANTAGAPVQTVNLDYTMPLSGVFGLSATLGAQNSYASTLGGSSGRFFSALPSMVVSDQWNPRAQAFVEAFGQTRTRPDGGALFGVDAAFQYLLTPSLELDVEAGQTVTDVNRAHYAGAGFAVRF